MAKKFRLQDVEGRDVMGGLLELGNAYVSAYGELMPGSRPPDELEVDEFCKKEYALSGQKATVYVLVRVE
jgi:hypothetical protein